MRDVLEQRGEVDLLLEVGAERHARLLSDDRHHRLVIRLGVVQPGEQMNGARSGGCKAYDGFTGELGVAARHERGGFLVPRLDELDLVAGAIERADHAVDAVAGITVNAAHAP